MSRSLHKELNETLGTLNAHLNVPKTSKQINVQKYQYPQ